MLAIIKVPFGSVAVFGQKLILDFRKVPLRRPMADLQTDGQFAFAAAATATAAAVKLQTVPTSAGRATHFCFCHFCARAHSTYSWISASFQLSP